ncbi:MAG: ABC-type multidrug transport system fused ATPase/permease subunit [Myxococcota bacterium]|jgi:ABC-type multidrug transport system fused ATPase/permease subunit
MAHPLLRMAPLFRPDRGLLIASGALLLIGTALNLIGPWLVSQAIDVDLASGDSAGLLTRAGMYLGVIVAGLVVTYGARIGIEIVAQRAMVVLKSNLFDHLLDHDLALHDEQSSGRLITRIQGDIEALRMLFTEVILTSPADLVLFVGMFAIMFSAAPSLAPLVALVIPVWIVLFLVFRKIAPPHFIALRKIRAGLTGFFTEHIRAMPVLQVLGRGAWARERSEALNQKVYRATAIAEVLPVGYFNSIFLTRNLGVVLLLWVGAGYVSEGLLTVGALVMGLGYLRQLFGPLMRLSHHQSTIERARAAAIRISELLDTPRQITDPPHPTPWPGLQDALRLEDVDFHYVEGAPVLQGLSMTIPAGSSVGIVGSTGAGKSTVLNLLLRFRDPIAGRVSVDGVDLRDLALSALRSRVGLVLQDVHLFPGTVLENLGEDAPAAQRAMDILGIALPLDRTVGDGTLSRGERQLLTFARALVTDPEILVLDEATSAVDPATEATVQQALARLSRGRTTITVAHRLITVRQCDLIFVLHQGRLTEQGTHDQLIAAGGVYAALAALQEVA